MEWNTADLEVGEGRQTALVAPLQRIEGGMRANLAAVKTPAMPPSLRPRIETLARALEDNLGADVELRKAAASHSTEFHRALGAFLSSLKRVAAGTHSLEIRCPRH